MNQQKKTASLDEYLKKYFDDMLIRDIEIMIEKELRFTIPYVLLTCSGIDFLGGLEKGFAPGRRKSRFVHFIDTWMGELDNRYSEENLGLTIYSLARNGVSHQSLYKNGIECSSEPEHEEKHLQINLNSGNLFLHAWQLATDFIKAQDLFRKEYIAQNVDLVHNNLDSLLKQNKGNDKITATLIRYLQDTGHTFEDDSAEPSRAPDELQ